MYTHYNVTLPKAPSIPATKNHALALMKWMRIAMDVVDRAKPYEQTLTRTVLVSRVPADLGGTSLKEKLKSDDNIIFRFEIWPMEFLDLEAAKANVVLLRELSAAWLFDENWSEVGALASDAATNPTDQTKQGNVNVHRLAEDLANSVRPRVQSGIALVPPDQDIGLEDLAPSERSWDIPALHLTDVSAWNTGTPTLDSRQDMVSPLLHCSPIGVWTAHIPPMVHIGYVPHARSQLSLKVPHVAGEARKRVTLSDLMLTMNILVLPKMKADERLVRAFEEPET
jgi:hypothetical protein